MIGKRIYHWTYACFFRQGTQANGWEGLGKGGEGGGRVGGGLGEGGGGVGGGLGEGGGGGVGGGWEGEMSKRAVFVVDDKTGERPIELH